MATERELRFLRQGTFGDSLADLNESFFTSTQNLKGSHYVRGDTATNAALQAKLNPTKDDVKKRNLMKIKLTTNFDIIPLVRVEEPGIVFVDQHFLYTVTEYMITAWGSTKESFDDMFDFQGHTDRVTGMASLPGLLFSVSLDGTLKIWDTDNGQCLETLYSENAVGFTALARHEHVLYSGDEETTVQIFDLETRQEKLVNVEPQSSFYAITSVLVASGRVWCGGNPAGKIMSFGVADTTDIISLAGHQEVVTCLTEHDDITLFSGSKDGTVRRWDLVDRKCTGIFEGNNGQVFDIVATHGIIVACDLDCLRTYDAETQTLINVDGEVHARSLSRYKEKAVVSSGLTEMIEARQLLSVAGMMAKKKRKQVLGKTVRVLTAPFRWVGRGLSKLAFEGHSARITCIDAFKSKIYTGAEDATVRVWDIETGACINVYYGHDKAVTCLQFRGGHVFSGSLDRTVIKWSDRGRPETTYTEHTAAVRALYVTTGARSRDMYTGGDDHIIIGRCVTAVDVHRQFVGHQAPISYLLEEGTHLFSVSLARSIRVWNIRSCLCVHRFEIPTRLKQVAYVHTKNIIAVSGSNTLQNWVVPSGTFDHNAHTFTFHSGVVTCVKACGALLMSGSDDNTICSVNILTGQVGPKFIGHTNWVQAIDMVSDEEIVTAGYDGMLRFWDPMGANTRSSETSIEKILDIAMVAADMIAVAGAAREILIIDTKYGTELAQLKGHKDTVTSLHVLDNFLYSASFDGTVLKWDLQNETKIIPVLQYNGHEDRVLCLTSTGNRFLFAGANDGVVLEWDAETGVQRRSYTGHNIGAIHSLQVEWDPVLGYPKQLFSAGADGVIYIWSCATGEMSMVYEGHTSTIKSLQLYAGTLFSGGADATVRAWRTQNQLVKKAESPILPSSVSCTDVSPSVTHVFVGGEDKMARKYHWHEMKKDQSGFVGHERAVSAIKYAHPHLLTGCDDGSARMWSARTHECRQQFKSAIQSPIWVFITLVIVCVEFAQLLSLPFVVDVPWSQDTIVTEYVRLIAQVITADVKSSYLTVFWAASGWILLFMICYALDVAWDMGGILLRKGRRSALARAGYKVFWFVLWSTSTLLFVPLFRSLVLVLDCSYPETGDPTLDISVEIGDPNPVVCWMLPHLFYACLAIILLVLYVPATLRLAIVEGDIARVHKSFWRWNRDNFMLENQHACSRRGVSVELIFYSFRTIMICIAILFTQRVDWVIPSFFGMSCFLFLITIILRPYFDYRMNSFYLALIVQLVGVNGTAYAVMKIDETGGDTHNITLFLFIAALPALILTYLFFKVVRKMCLPCFEDENLRKTKSSDDDVYVDPLKESAPLGVSRGIMNIPPLISQPSPRGGYDSSY